MKAARIFPLILLLNTFNTSGQVSVPGSFFQGINILNDSDNLAFYSSVDSEQISEPFQVINPRTAFSYNSSYPRGLNDGPVWKGKGLTTEIHFGVAGKIGNLSYSFHPVIYHSQNSNFALAPLSSASIDPRAYQYSGVQIDWVQQYGEGSFNRFHPGQSEIRLQFGKFISSISTQNYSVGPSVFNPIILSRQGAGFPHLRLGSDPLNLEVKDVNIGKFEMNYMVGFLKESEYYDSNPDNDTQYINALFLAFSPGILPNLTLGFNKSLYKETQRFDPQDLLSVITVLDTVGPNDQFDQLASATIEWKFPDQGFRAYAEFAYNDFGGKYKWIEPEHSRAYTIGFEKETTFNNQDKMHIVYEHTNLSRNHTYLWRATPTFYAHSVNRQGYTHQGQILGAGIGPGFNSDMIIVKYIRENKVIGISGQRIENNKDYFVVNIADRRYHDIEYSGGFFYQHEFDKFLASLEAIYSKNNNRYWKNDESNIFTSLSLLYRLNSI